MTEHSPDPMTAYRAQLDQYRAQAEAHRPLLEGTLQYAELAMKNLFLLTGGAAIALLAFTGNALNGAKSLRLEALANAVWWCGVAAALAVLVAGFSYLAQLFSHAPDGTTGSKIFNGLRAIAIMLWLASLGLFLLGVDAASTALSPDVASVTTFSSLPHELEFQLGEPTVASGP
jgi:hypothetical protein